MPTGYTAPILDGITFKEFALNSARAFGACVDLRDAPAGGDQIPELFEPNPFYLERLESALERLREVRDLSDEDCEQMADDAYSNDEALRIEQLGECSDRRSKYQAMLDQARAWVPPTHDHTRMREFMIEQIERSILFDCEDEHLREPVKRLTGAEWRQRETERLADDAAYYSKASCEEIERVNLRNAWIKALRDSL